MIRKGDGAPPPAAAEVPNSSPLPPTSVPAVLGGMAVLGIVVSAWLAVKPAAETAQTGLVLWFNHPPQPFAAIFAVVNPLLRPIPLVVVAALLVGWILLTAAGTAYRLEQVRALVVAVAIAELAAQLMKRLADQPRPLSVIPGLDTHGYPSDPLGNAYPSAHTAMSVAAVCALWPWTSRPQRIVGVSVVALVACNRLYIGAHWPIDIIGGAAIGLLAASITWLIAARWPIQLGQPQPGQPPELPQKDTDAAP